jgi:hypothetical protein
MRPLDPLRRQLGSANANGLLNVRDLLRENGHESARRNATNGHRNETAGPTKSRETGIGTVTEIGTEIEIAREIAIGTVTETEIGIETEGLDAKSQLYNCTFMNTYVPHA